VYRWLTPIVALPFELTTETNVLKVLLPAEIQAGAQGICRALLVALQVPDAFPEFLVLDSEVFDRQFGDSRDRAAATHVDRLTPPAATSPRSRLSGMPDLVHCPSRSSDVAILAR